MITLIAASLTATVPAAQPAPPHVQHASAKQAQTSGQPARQQEMDGMKGCCCKGMQDKAAHKPAEPAAKDHSGH